MRYFSYFLPKSPIWRLVDFGEELGEGDGLSGRQEGADDLPGVGGLDVEAAIAEVVAEVHEGMQAELYPAMRSGPVNSHSIQIGDGEILSSVGLQADRGTTSPHA